MYAASLDPPGWLALTRPPIRASMASLSLSARLPDVDRTFSFKCTTGGALRGQVRVPLGGPGGGLLPGEEGGGMRESKARQVSLELKAAHFPCILNYVCMRAFVCARECVCMGA